MRISIALSFIFLCIVSIYRADADVTVTALVLDNTSTTTTITPPPPPPPPSTGGGGGGGSPGGPSTQTATNYVIFRGLAYPNATVTLLKNGVFTTEVTADPDGIFQISLASITAGTYNFSLRAKDIDGYSSALKNYTIQIASNITTLIEDITFPSTLDIDKSEIKRGELLTISGRTAPNAKIAMVINSVVELIKYAVADDRGIWSYKLDTSPLEYGSHQVKAHGTTDTELIPFSQALSFKVGDVSITKAPEKNNTCSRYDLNCDGKINIADFSIMAYWYNKPHPPNTVDLNHDGKVNLADFSILAYYWTG